MMLIKKTSLILAMALLLLQACQPSQAPPECEHELHLKVEASQITIDHEVLLDDEKIGQVREVASMDEVAWAAVCLEENITIPWDSKYAFDDEKQEVRIASGTAAEGWQVNDTIDVIHIDSLQRKEIVTETLDELFDQISEALELLPQDSILTDTAVRE